jgi:kumamolisin
MVTPQHYVLLPGSENPPHPNARTVGAVDPDQQVRVTVQVRGRRADAAHRRLEAAGDGLAEGARHLTRAEFAAQHGADPADLAKVEEFARDHGLEVVRSSVPERSVVLSGTLRAFTDALRTAVELFESPRGNYRGRTAAVQVPAGLAPIVEGIFGLSNRPIARPHFQLLQEAAPQAGMAAVGAAPQATAARTFTPVEVARLYNFPTGVDGTGQCIGIIELGGGFDPDDLETYFQNLQVPLPQVVAVPVNSSAGQGQNQPTGDPGGPDGEVMLDIEVAGAVAPGAKLAVYFAPDASFVSFLDAMRQAIHDEVNRPSVISVSWGAPERFWDDSQKRSMNSLLRDAALLGITVTVASGDNGSSDMTRAQVGTNLDDGLAHVDFPSSSPFALACGGTRLLASGTAISQEAVWNVNRFSASGGGVSDFFGVPKFQLNAHVQPSTNPGHRVGRGVPDIAGNADPNTGYAVRVDGQDTAIGGTSAVAPLWAGLIALVNQIRGHRVGFLNPLLYSRLAGTGALHDITAGNNGAYQAHAGWDPCTGLGTPDGDLIQQTL